MWRHFTTTTPVYNSPTLYYSAVGTSGPFSIRLRPTTYRVASGAARLEITTAIPQIYGNTASYGTSHIIEGASELPKLQLEGHIDTPTTPGSNPLASSVLLGGQPSSYGDVISAALEGRAGSVPGAAVNPDYFLDPFGRKFSSPRITAFTAQYIQGVPYRQNFSMTLQLTRGSNS
jgi:hypothetical protein